MRPLRFTLFLALLTGLVSAAGYLWAPLVRPSSPQLRLSAPALRWNVLPVRIPAPTPPNRSALHLLPLRVEGSFVLNHPRPRPKTHEVKLRVATPIVAKSTAPLEQPAAPVAQRPDLRPSIAPAATAPPALPALPEPVIRPASPTPGEPIPLPLAPQPAVPATPPTPQPVPPAPQPVVPVTPPATGTSPPAAQPATPPAPSQTPAPTPVSEPPPPPTTTPTPPTPPSTPPPSAETTARPGWGCGDHNHTHGGPPGKSDSASPC